MKGARLLILIGICIAIVTTSIMTIMGVTGNFYPSWSQIARSIEEPVLLATLGIIWGIYIVRSFTFQFKDRSLYRFGGLNIRIKHLNRYTALFFWMVSWTPVTIGVWWIETLHLVVTFLAIAFAYMDLAAFYKGTTDKLWGYSSVGIAAMGMLGALWMQLWTVGIGEFIAMAPIAIHLLRTNKYINTN